MTSCSTFQRLILFAGLIFTLLDYADTSIMSKTGWINRLVQCLLLCLQLFLLMHAHPILVAIRLFDQKLMRSHLHTCVSNGVWFLFPVRRCRREKRSDVLCIKQLLVYCNYRMPASFSNEIIQCGKCGKSFQNRFYSFWLLLFSSLQCLINSFCCFVNYVVGPSLNTISLISLVIYHGNCLFMHSGHSK